MAYPYTTSTEIPPAIREIYKQDSLERCLSNHCFGLFAQFKKIAKNSGDQPKFIRYDSLTEATAPLNEIVTPDPQQGSKTVYTGQLELYGSHVILSTYALQTNQDDLIHEYSKIVGENAEQSLDLIYRDALSAGTTEYWADCNNVSANGSVDDPMLLDDLETIVVDLEAESARKFMDKPMYGGSKENSYPLPPCFFGICHSHCKKDLIGMTGFRYTAEYAAPEDAIQYEVGMAAEVRWLSTQNVEISTDDGTTASTNGLRTTGGTNADIYSNYIFGRDAFGICPLTDDNYDLIVKLAGDNGTEDPHNQRNTVAWGALTDLVILQNLWFAQYHTGASA